MPRDDYNMYTDGSKHTIITGKQNKNFQSGYNIIV